MNQFDELPEQIQERMLELQEQQGNKRDPAVYRKNILDPFRGFEWNKSPEGYEFWADIIVGKNYDNFSKTK